MTQEQNGPNITAFQEFIAMGVIDTTQPASATFVVEPLLGQRVHYVLKDGQHRAATVVNTIGSTRANLTVHLDGSNDLQPQTFQTDQFVMPNPNAGRCKWELVPVGASNFLPGVLAVGSAEYDQTTMKPGTYHHQEML